MAAIASVMRSRVSIAARGGVVAGGGVGVGGVGVGGGQRRGASREGEVVQRGQYHRGIPLAGRHRLDGPQGLVGLAQRERDPLVQRRRVGALGFGEASVHLRERAGATHG